MEKSSPASRPRSVPASAARSRPATQPQSVRRAHICAASEHSMMKPIARAPDPWIYLRGRQIHGSICVGARSMDLFGWSRLCGALTANCKINATFLWQTTLFRGIFYISSAFSTESPGKRWHLYSNWHTPISAKPRPVGISFPSASFRIHQF